MTRSDNIRLKFKKKKDPISVFAVIFAIGIGVGLIVISTKLYATTVYATKGDDIVNLEAERTQYVEMNKEIEAEIAQYQSIDRVQKDAQDRLGMVKATNVQYIDVTSTPAGYK